MTIQDIAEKIQKARFKNFDSRYLLGLNDIQTLTNSNASRAELIIYSFKYGYMQGAKATKKELREKVAQK